MVGVDRVSHAETRGIEVLNGKGVIEGKLLGGCIESLYDQITGERYPEEKDIIRKYEIFPSTEEWKDKIFFTETSEEKPTPQKLRRILESFENASIFESIAGIMVGKPQDEKYYDEYKQIWIQIAQQYNLPIIYNLNFGHGTPRCILPYGGTVRIDLDKAIVTLQEQLVS